MATIESVANDLSMLTKEVKSMHKLLRKVRQFQEDPTGEKAKERSARSGFNRLQRVSPQLGSFLGLSQGEGVSRGEVTKRINAYVKENNLNHPDNKRIFLLDAKLKTILSVPDGVDLQFTNLQTYLKPHYLGPLDEEAAAVAAEPPKTPVVKKIVKKPVVVKKEKA
jgi:chromatin remodeling complex protein RSC6